MIFVRNLARHVLAVAICVSSTSMSAGAPTILKGQNGQEAEFVAVFDATPEVLIVLATPEATAIRVPWQKIDLDDLKTRNGPIFAAYQKAVATGKTQPLGLGLAENMLSLSQLPAALKQAVSNPSEWPFEYYSPYVYTYRTTTTNAAGEVSVQTRTVAYKTTANYPYTSRVYLTLKKLRDSKDDKEKKEILDTLKSYSTGLDLMMERIDWAMERIPPEKMFKREASHLALIRAAGRFKEKIRALQSATIITFEDQAVVKEFFTLLDVK